MSGLRCRAVAVVENLTWPAWWAGLLGIGPRVEVAPHVWPDPPLWTTAREHPDWPGLVEYEVLECRLCGTRQEGPGWRPFYGVLA